MRLFISFIFIPILLLLQACSTNPATGENQFTALLPPEREAQLGAQEHQKVEGSFGGFVEGPIAQYVQSVGNKIVPHTERKDVQYKFYVVDSPIVNAFAIPGGYVYVSRGLLALANSEAELAAVIAHEIGHITGRHSAERMSQGFLVNLGATILSAAVDSQGITQAAGLGSELYLKSYSRGQENEADNLGVRYLHRAGYDHFAMSRFLQNLANDANLQAQIEGRNRDASLNYFSTHPLTEDRVASASNEASKFAKNQAILNTNAYLKAIDGLTYGDSAKQGFLKDQVFYHPDIGFRFEFPQGFKVRNSPSEVAGLHSNGSVILFDSARTKQAVEPASFLRNVWMKEQDIKGLESIQINGFPAATASFQGRVNNVPMTIRLVAIQWKPNEFFRFQMGIPNSVNAAFVDGLKKTTYSFRKMSAQEKQSVRPKRLDVVAAKEGDSVGALSSRMAYKDFKEERFRVLNGLKPNENLQAGRLYKIVRQ